MTKSLSKFKKPCFWPIFGGKKIFQENLALLHSTSNEFLAPLQDPEKNNDTTPRKHSDRRKQGLEDPIP